MMLKQLVDHSYQRYTTIKFSFNHCQLWKLSGVHLLSSLVEDLATMNLSRSIKLDSSSTTMPAVARSSTAEVCLFIYFAISAHSARNQPTQPDPNSSAGQEPDQAESLNFSSKQLNHRLSIFPKIHWIE